MSTETGFLQKLALVVEQVSAGMRRELSHTNAEEKLIPSPKSAPSAVAPSRDFCSYAHEGRRDLAGHQPPLAHMQRDGLEVLADDFDVFMAHNSRDKETVLEIARQLRRIGIYPWVDAEQIPPGRWFQDAIQNVIPRVRAVAIFLGTNGIGRWEVLELRVFISQCVERGLPVIPVLLPGVATIPADLAFLRELHAVKFVTGATDADALAKLQWGITGER